MLIFLLRWTSSIKALQWFCKLMFDSAFLRWTTSVFPHPFSAALAVNTVLDVITPRLCFKSKQVDISQVLDVSPCTFGKHWDQAQLPPGFIKGDKGQGFLMLSLINTIILCKFSERGV